MQQTADITDNKEVVRESIENLRLDTIEALSLLESAAPVTVIHNPTFHMLLHFPGAIYEWNSIRNYWQFFGERYFTLITFHMHFQCIINALIVSLV